MAALDRLLPFIIIINYCIATNSPINRTSGRQSLGSTGPVEPQPQRWSQRPRQSVDGVARDRSTLEPVESQVSLIDTSARQSHHKSSAPLTNYSPQARHEHLERHLELGGASTATSGPRQGNIDASESRPLLRAAAAATVALSPTNDLGSDKIGKQSASTKHHVSENDGDENGSSQLMGSDYVDGERHRVSGPTTTSDNITRLEVNNRATASRELSAHYRAPATTTTPTTKATPTTTTAKATTTTTTPLHNNNGHSDSAGRSKRRARLQQAPTFGQPIGNVSAVAGRDVRLICTVDNLGHYQVAWLKLESKTILSIDTNIITTNYRIFLIPDEEERKWVLHIKDVQESDRGYYQCQLNTIPMRSITGHLEVVVSPTIIESQSSQQLSVQEYSNVTLTCKTYAHPKASTTWKRDDGLPIRLNGASVSQQLDQDAHNESQSINSLAVNHNIPMALEPTTNQDNDNDNDYHMTSLHTSQQPISAHNSRLLRAQITQQNSHHAVMVDDDQLKSHPEPGGAISASSNWLNLTEGKFAPFVISSPIETQYKSEKLTLTNVSRSFTGVYICTSSNGIPPAAIKKIPLFINFPPKTSLLNQYISANVGDTIELDCMIEAYPKSSNHWARTPNGEELSWTHVLGQSEHGEIVEGTLLDGTERQQQQPPATNNNSTNKNHIHLSYHPHNRLNNRGTREKVIRDHDEPTNKSKSPNIVTTNTSGELATSSNFVSDQTQTSLADGNDERVYVSVKQSSVNSYTNQLKLTIPSLRRQDFGKYTCFARNSLGVSQSSVVIREIVKTSQYLPQRPANMMQSDSYSEQRDSFANQPKKLAINTTHRNLIKHPGYGNSYYGDHASSGSKVYDEKYIQAIKARTLSLNTANNYNSNFDKNVQRLKLKNAQNGSQASLTDAMSFDKLMVIATITLWLVITLS